jgi:hypothetical protein
MHMFLDALEGAEVGVPCDDYGMQGGHVPSRIQTTAPNREGHFQAEEKELGMGDNGYKMVVFVVSPTT